MDLNLPFLPGKNPFDIHCYFEPDKAEVAAALKEKLCARFDWLEQGRFTKSAGAVSPHPRQRGSDSVRCSVWAESRVVHASAARQTSTCVERGQGAPAAQAPA